jgi:hypothetical protein
MKLTEIPPVRCSACFGQYTERRHVDFEAAWEGPTFKEGIAGEDGEILNAIPVSIDDLILCEDCLRAAAALIGLKDPDEVSEYAEQLETQRDELLEKVRGFERHSANLEASIASKRELTGAGR